MKKIATYIMLGFWSVGVASPAFTDHEGGYRDHPKDSVNANYFDCEFIREQAKDDVERLRSFQIISNKGTDPSLEDEIRYGLQNANAWANIYHTFCQ